jgi:hypothetical protein
MPDAATRARIQDLLNRIQDAYFDYDKHTLRPDAETALRSDAQTLAEIVRQYPDFKLKSIQFAAIMMKTAGKRIAGPISPRRSKFEF